MSIEPSFSFIYENKSSEIYLPELPYSSEASQLDISRTEHVLKWSDPRSGLEIKCQSIKYADFPAVEWMVYFKNNGHQDTGIIKEIKALDLMLRNDADTGFVLNGIRGDWCVAESFEPYCIELEPGTSWDFAPENGKSSGGPNGFPYFNLQMPGGGIFIAIGWPGQWAASFKCDRESGLIIKAGQEITNLYLKPGEEIRTPLIVMMDWTGDDLVAAQNQWRRWMWAHNTPTANGQRPDPLTQIQLGNDDAGLYASVEKFLDHGVKPDLCWKDAGWYPVSGGPYQGPIQWLNTGTWDPDPERFPKGFKPFSDWIKARGMKFILWFEPERVGDPRSFLGQHPEWLLDNGENSAGMIFNEGDPDALEWLINHVDGMIKSEGIDWYREDMNGPGPLTAWRKNDAPDRQGITENFYVQGHLRFWDEIVRRNSQIYIDSCASGGRRNDIETMRRAVPLLRSDYQFPEDLDPKFGMKIVFEANQAQTMALSSWFPYYGSGVYGIKPYEVRSFYMPAFGLGPLENWEKDEKSILAVRRAYDECRTVAPDMLGDYYPMTQYSLDLDQWAAWQFNRPEAGSGFVQAFRRPQCADALRVFRLRGLDSGADYILTDLDTDATVIINGKILMDDGLEIRLVEKPAASVFIYKRVV
jgi:alpha-galactosidase